MDLLRLATAGNVDDGKSTLIGRLLYDCQAIYDDQLRAVRDASRHLGDGETNLALLLDGLKAEREQGITIDVAYRYFTTASRKFILADCPGHFEYTRNMVTGASTADVSVILVDVRNGLAEQTRRHCLISALLRIPRLVVCVNKMDLVGYRAEPFHQVCEQFQGVSRDWETGPITFIPVAAARGDNVVNRSEKMPWYAGPTLLDYLQAVDPSPDSSELSFRLPIQLVLREKTATEDARWYAGMVASGRVRIGDKVMALPSRAETTVKGIEIAGRQVARAEASQSIAVRLEGAIDLARGDMLVPPESPTRATRELDATLCWLNQEPLDFRRSYLVRHTTAEARARVIAILEHIGVGRVDEEARGRAPGLNELARVRLRTSQPLFCDPYRINRVTGSFVLVDESSYMTVAAGMIR